MLSGDGGGIFNAGELTISNSTLSGNIADGGDFLHHGFAQGGGIDNIRTLTISNSTLSGNSVSGKAGAFGGGIANAAGTLTISNSTLSGNASTFTSSSGGGISNFRGASATLQNSIVANSPSGGNCSGGMTSKGYNLSSDGTCSFNGHGDLNNTDPKLGPLQNNGGPTQTMALPSGSSAIDAGNPNGCTDGDGHLLKTDQRGFPRPDKEDTGGLRHGRVREAERLTPEPLSWR